MSFDFNQTAFHTSTSWLLNDAWKIWQLVVLCLRVLRWFDQENDNSARKKVTKMTKGQNANIFGFIAFLLTNIFRIRENWVKIFSKMVKVSNLFATVSQRMGNWKRLKNRATIPTTSLNGLHKCLHTHWNVKKACGINWQRRENFLKNAQIWQLFDDFS